MASRPAPAHEEDGQFHRTGRVTVPGAGEPPPATGDAGEGPVTGRWTGAGRRQATPIRLIVASGNPAKVAAVDRLLAGAATVLPLPHNISTEGESDEEAGATVDAVAAAKALAWSRRVAAARAVGRGTRSASARTGRHTDQGAAEGDEEPLVLATDGGLLFPALGSAWDPVRTRRFAGPDADGVDRARALLARAEGLDGDDRRIGWREAVAVARGDAVVVRFAAESPPGDLARAVEPALVVAGEGFWLPAVWRCPEYGGRLLAELLPAERDARDDHWSRLGADLRRWLADQHG